MNRTSFYVYKALRGKFSEHASDNLSGRIYIASDFFLRLLNFKLSTLFIGGHKVRSQALIELFEKHHLQSPERLRKTFRFFFKDQSLHVDVRLHQLSTDGSGNDEHRRILDRRDFRFKGQLVNHARRRGNAKYWITERSETTVFSLAESLLQNGSLSTIKRTGAVFINKHLLCNIYKKGALLWRMNSN